MEVKKLELVLAILFILAGLLGLVAKLTISVLAMGMTAEIPLSEKLNTLEELTLFLQTSVNKLITQLSKFMAQVGGKAPAVKVEIGGTTPTLAEVIILLIAGIVALLIGACTLKEDKKSILALIGGIFLLVGPIYLLYLYSSSKLELTSWLYPFALVGVGLVIYSLRPLIEKETLTRVVGIVLLLAGITILVPRVMVLSKVSSINLTSLTSISSLPKIELYYLPFIGSLLLLVGGVLLILKVKKAE